jgi:arylsulfatase
MEFPMRARLNLISILILIVGPLPATAFAQQQQPPNVLVWMMDDVGFAQVSAFGGLVETPTIDRVAHMGLSYINYHTAPICSAARAAFLSGRMPHSVHIGGHATAAMAALQGYDAHIPASAGSIAANLHAAGYATFALGKWDHLPNEEASPAGPFNQWALGQGFDHFYGFLAADADNWNPILIRDLTPVAKPANPAYHLSADLADQAIAMLQSRAARNPQRPVFIYWATGAAHAPHHAPRDWIEHYRGRFDMGWDQARDTILRQQKDKGLVPKGAELAPRPAGMATWNSLSADQKRLYAHQMEVFAAALSYADAQFGRILDALMASGQLDNTLVIVTSDNGASAEGGPDGLYDEAEVTSTRLPSVKDNLAFYDKWGGPQTYPHYAYGWAVAGDTPYRYYKQTTHEGGTRVPLVIAWPKGIAARGELRSQFVHVSDIAPTILAAVGVTAAATINNVPQSPMEGQSVAATFADNSMPGHQGAQYVELYGNKGLWLDNWSIVTTHRTRMWDFNVAKTFDEPWELYDLRSDPGQAHDLAARFPERVADMSRQFEEQAQRFHVYPQHNLSDTLAGNAAKARADFERRGGRWHYTGPVGNIPSALAPPITSRSFAMTATLDLPRPGITGPLFSFGGQMGGMAFYLENGKPALILNTLKGASAQVVAREGLGAGKSNIELDFDHGPAAPDGSTEYRVTIKSNGRVLARQSLYFAIPGYFGISETFGIGTDEGSPVLAGYAAGTPFAGRLSEVEFNFMRPAMQMPK